MHAPMASTRVVAIDFGTTRSACAYTVEGEAEDRIMVRIPESARDIGSSRFKTDTAVLIDDKGKGDCVAYGVAALTQVQARAEGVAQTEALFRWFKLGLCENAGFDSVSSPVATSTASTGKHEVPLLDVMAASLRHFKDDMLEFLSSTAGIQITTKDISWVLTVPAVYDDFAKNFMRNASYKAGMIDSVGSGNLKICLEPEAACLQVATCDHPLQSDAVGKHTMVVDCGGGTVDITMHTVVSVDPLRLMEVLAPDGGPWGSVNVDMAFERWLESFLGDVLTTKIKQTAAWLKILLEWEQLKATFNGTRPLYLNLLVPAQNGITADRMEILRSSFNDSQPNSDHITGSGCMVILPPTLVTSFFAPTISSIRGCLESITSSLASDNLLRVFLVGGFSRCRLLQQVVYDVVGHDRVLLAHEPDLVIVKGAVLFHSMPEVFVSRKARLTYGVGTSRPYDSNDPEHARRHRAGKSFKDDDGCTRINDCFSRHIAVGEDLPMDGVFKKEPYFSVYRCQEDVAFSIYATTKEDAMFVDEEGCFKLGHGSVALDMHMPFKERCARVQFTYGDTEMTVKFFHAKADRELEGRLTVSQMPPQMKRSRVASSTTPQSRNVVTEPPMVLKEVSEERNRATGVEDVATHEIKRKTSWCRCWS